MPHDPRDDAERQRIGKRIQDVRIDRNLTQEQVYLAIPLTRSFYQAIESGRANPSLNTLIRIARAIGVPISDLLGSG